MPSSLESHFSDVTLYCIASKMPENVIVHLSTVLTGGRKMSVFLRTLWGLFASCFEGYVESF